MTEPSWCWAGLNKGDDKSSWWWQQSRSVAVWVVVMSTDISKAECVCVRGGYKNGHAKRHRNGVFRK